MIVICGRYIKAEGQIGIIYLVILCETGELVCFLNFKKSGRNNTIP